MRKISEENYQGELSIIISLESFEDMAWKNGGNFSSFNPSPIMPSTATDNRRQFQCREIVFNNQSGALFFEFN